MRESPVSVVARHLLATVATVKVSMKTHFDRIGQQFYSTVSEEHVRTAAVVAPWTEEPGGMDDDVC